MGQRTDQQKVVHLLKTTCRGYRDLAAEFQCSHQNIARIAVKFGLNTAERRAASHLRAQLPRRLVPDKYPDIRCPRCNSTFIGAWERRGNRYGTPRFKCRDCGGKFLKEYKWVSSGDQACHLAVICQSSGYSRPDNSLRLLRYWEHWRTTRYWPYATKNHNCEILDIINNAVPRSLPEHIRADVCQEAAVAIMEGRMEPDQVELRPLLRQWFKDNLIGYQSLSLDGPSLSHDSKTLGEAWGYC
jgi:hypothetical protein